MSPLRFDRRGPALGLAAGILVALAVSAAVASPVIGAPVAMSSATRGGSASHTGDLISLEAAKIRDKIIQMQNAQPGGENANRA